MAEAKRRTAAASVYYGNADDSDIEMEDAIEESLQQQKKSQDQSKSKSRGNGRTARDDDDSEFSEEEEDSDFEPFIKRNKMLVGSTKKKSTHGKASGKPQKSQKQVEADEEKEENSDSDNNEKKDDEGLEEGYASLDPELIALAQGRRTGRVRKPKKIYEFEEISSLKKGKNNDSSGNDGDGASSTGTSRTNKANGVTGATGVTKKINKPKTSTLAKNPDSGSKVRASINDNDSDATKATKKLEKANTNGEEKDAGTETKKSTKESKSKSSAQKITDLLAKVKPRASKKTAATQENGVKKQKEKENGASESNKADKDSSEWRYDLKEMARLVEEYPDKYGRPTCSISGDVDGQPQDANDNSGPIEFIDSSHPLQLVDCSITDQGPISGITLSDCGTMLATFSSSGAARVWCVETFECLQKLRDDQEPNIDEFYVGQFTEDSSHLLVGGKLKDRHRWSEADDDNHILPCPIKIFDTVSAKCVAKLDGHFEEILCIKRTVYKNKHYWISTSQDGFIRRWPMNPDYVTMLAESESFVDGESCMVFGVSFLPNTANRLFMAACDERVKLFDMETCSVIQIFEQSYSSYCDCAKFVSLPYFKFDVDGDGDGDEGQSENQNAAYLFTRGVELVDDEKNSTSTIPNSVTLHKLIYPKHDNGKFQLVEVKRFHHEDYLSNSWLIRISSNGRYILAPTYNGQVFIFHIQTGKLVGILRDHQAVEVRDIKFHPFKKMLFTSGDDGSVKVYRQTEL